jgi:hypothetical protein
MIGLDNGAGIETLGTRRQPGSRDRDRATQQHLPSTSGSLGACNVDPPGSLRFRRPRREPEEMLARSKIGMLNERPSGLPFPATVCD